MDISLEVGTVDSNNLNVTNRYWKPNASVIKIVEQICATNGYTKNLEIGPGFVPFSLATDFIGSNENVTEYIDIDIDKDVFPYKRQTFDFIYCRHVLEDIQNPDFALREMFRICKLGAGASGGGYIETPSPLIEVTKGVDGTGFANHYCGYIHHRYLVWSSIERNEIYFLPKYSCILDHVFHIDEAVKPYAYYLINYRPVYWNNYFVFMGREPKVIMYKNGVNFNTKNGHMVREYIALVNRAINESIENTKYFINKYKDLLESI